MILAVRKKMTVLRVYNQITLNISKYADCFRTTRVSI